ncbi:hypothetical protein OHJ16_00640 [Actinomyces israelii]|uniref:Uncharacterized protein n=1 Tax=Actinomyces israelii TaxID=1659 RepID=A0ABT4I492_9ACTO|nr:hypothetical protein [Actinomyces israelii]MCZ0856556.1 hypothetical protein [Actinomyces israelii]
MAVMFEPSFTGGTAPGTISIPAMVLGPDGSVLKDVTTSTARPDFVHRADGGKAVEVASAPAGKRRLPEAWSQDPGEAPVDDDSTGSADRSAPTGTVVVSPAEGLSSLLSKNRLTTVTYSEDSMTLTLYDPDPLMTLTLWRAGGRRWAPSGGGLLARWPNARGPSCVKRAPEAPC